MSAIVSAMMIHHPLLFNTAWEPTDSVLNKETSLADYTPANSVYPTTETRPTYNSLADLYNTPTTVPNYQQDNWNSYDFGNLQPIGSVWDATWQPSFDGYMAPFFDM
jgi:hypothetical protein